MDESNQLASKDNLTEMEDSIRMISSLMNECDTLNHEKVILSDDLCDGHYHNKILNIRVNNLTAELASVQEDLSLATVDRLKLKDKWRQVAKHAGITTSTIHHSDQKNNNHIIDSLENIDGNRYYHHSGGVKSLQRDLKRLKSDLSAFEGSHQGLMDEIGELSRQIVIAENNLHNISYFRVTVERHMRQYRDRNARLESHLRVLYNDLLEMEGNHFRQTSDTAMPPRKGAKVLLEALNLHHYFSSVEQDLRDAREQNRALLEDQQDLKERCNALEQEKQVNFASSEYIQDSMVGQHSYISQLQKDKQQLAYDKERLQTKLSLFKDDKKRMLDNMQQLSRSLGATTHYNRELEAKLQSFKVDLSDMENRAFAHADKQHGGGAGVYDQIDGVTGERTGDFLCSTCRDIVNKKFLGISKNTQLLGDELLDCICDNLSLETAIFSMLEQKTFLEHDLHYLEANNNNNPHNLIRGGGAHFTTNSERSMSTYSSLSNYSETNITPGWSASHLSIEADLYNVPSGMKK